MEPSKEAIAVRITRLNRQIVGRVNSIGTSKTKRTIDREALLDALTVLYDECNEDPVKKSDELVRAFVDKYRSTLAELRRTRVCMSDFETLQTIGRGHFGEVHMVREKHTGDVYALKTLRKEQARKREVGAAEDERDVLATANSAWIPKLQYAFQDSSHLYLVMELCSGGDLAGLLYRRSHPMCERDAAFYVAEVAHALKALHGMGYVHRDVKPHNIFLDRCGHVKLGDLGSSCRLSEGSCRVAVGTPDYVCPELLAATHCATTHSVCLQYCRDIATTAITACDYWSLGVVAFELVTLKRPFSSGEDDSLAQILANIQKYERDPNAEPPFDTSQNVPSHEWRALVGGLLRVQPSKRFNYLDTLQHVALAHCSTHSIRDQAPPWVPCLRGAEDASCFSPAPRVPPEPTAAPFRTRSPFAGQLPFVGYSYVAPDEGEDSHSGGFSASLDCTAIDLATFKSAEKLAAMRGREVASLQSKLAAAEAMANVEAEKTRRAAEDEAERTRARLQAEITALSLQNRRLERQVEVEKEERMALERRNQELATGVIERNSAELRAAQAEAADLQNERDVLRNDMNLLEAKIAELQAECSRAVAEVDTAKVQQRHYKDTIAKERALRRQTLSGGEAESREIATRLAAAEANVAREVRTRELLERRYADLESENGNLRAELETVRKELTETLESLNEQKRIETSSSERLKELQTQLTQERVRASMLAAQVQESNRAIEETARREAALEEQYARTEARLNQRLEDAELRAGAALADEARHREKVNTLEQLVRQLEREVTALERRACPECAARSEVEKETNTHSDTESVSDGAQAQVALLKEQLDRAEAQLQARAEEMAILRQEARTANLAKWRKEREYNDLSVEAKSAARDIKRLEERLTLAVEARKTAEQKASALQSEMATLKPQYEQTRKEADTYKEKLEKLQKVYDTAQAEVDRSRNDIRKLKSELEYSERRRLHAEEQEEMSSRERAQMRDELHEMRAQNSDLVQNNKALQEACTVLEEQLTDLEKLADLHEIKNKDLEAETERMRVELSSCRERLSEAEKQASTRAAAAAVAAHAQDEAQEATRHAHCQIQLLTERLENSEIRVAELEERTASLEGSRASSQAALNNALRRERDLQEECATLRTRVHYHHSQALQLQAQLADAQEEVEGAREAAAAAAAWWRTRETKADATLRQQAKLIDFLQAKVEEAGRKKCSLTNKLFGRSGRRPTASPPLRRANRELREEVERLRSQLAAIKGSNEQIYPPTPKREKSSKTNVNRTKSIDTPDGADTSLQIVWPDGNRERMQAQCSNGVLVLTNGDKEIRGRLLSTESSNLPQNEANRSFTIRLETPLKHSEASVVCSNIVSRAVWVSRVKSADSTGYMPPAICTTEQMPHAALYIAHNATAFGCEDGLHSLRGPVLIEWESDGSPPRHLASEYVKCIAAVNGRALLVYGGVLAHGGMLALGSAIRRASNLKPCFGVNKVPLPDGSPPHLIKTVLGDTLEGPCAAVACGRRIFLLRFDGSNTEFKIQRSLTIDRPANSLLLTTKSIYIAGEKPLKINLPSGALEAFGMDEPIIAAAAKKHSPPKAILLIQKNPVEILICYAECGVFVDENGKRTRNGDPKWSSSVNGWEFVNPFLYVSRDEKITISHISEETFKSPPCTCDTTSLASTASDCYMPQTFTLTLKEPYILGKAPNGVIIRHKTDEGYSIAILEGMAAFRSIGASVESLATISDTKGSSVDLAHSQTDLSFHEISQESIEPSTGFLADIRKRARQLRSKNRSEQTPDEVIKAILTTEVGLKCTSNGRKSPATTSEFDSDSDSEERTDTTKGTADLCAEMFTRQVRFQ